MSLGIILGHQDMAKNMHMETFIQYGSCVERYRFYMKRKKQMGFGHRERPRVDFEFREGTYCHLSLTL